MYDHMVVVQSSIRFGQYNLLSNLCCHHLTIVNCINSSACSEEKDSTKPDCFIFHFWRILNINHEQSLHYNTLTFLVTLFKGSMVSLSLNQTSFRTLLYESVGRTKFKIKNETQHFLQFRYLIIKQIWSFQSFRYILHLYNLINTLSNLDLISAWCTQVVFFPE